MRFNLFPLIVVAGMMLSGSLCAQWASQTNVLRPGWNAVFFEVQPEPRDCATVFAGLPVETVWRYNRRYNPVQFIDDPNQLLEEPSAWLRWIPPGHPLAANKTLHIVEGGLAYLIKTTNASPLTWVLQGQPSLRKVQWLADSLNLVGSCAPLQSPPPFQTYLSGAQGITNGVIYRLNTSGIWQQVNNPASTLMQRGEAFWLRSVGLPTFQSPIEVITDRRIGLEYGKILHEETLQIRNNSPSARTVTLRQLPSQPPGSSAQPALAGPVPLNYATVAGNQLIWTNLPGVLQSNLAAGAVWSVRLAVRRPEMAPFTPPPGVSNALYQSLLEVESSGLCRQLVPVTAQGLGNGNGGQGQGGVFSIRAGEPHFRAGLWVGSAVINKVNEPASTSDRLTPRSTPAEFQLRLIVHVDDTGQASLLQKVLMMWKDGVYRTNQAGFREVEIPGRHVLVTDDRLIPNFSGSALRDGEPVGRRISSAAFGFREPLLFAGAGDFGSNTLTTTIGIDYNDPLNPFKHAFHPDHNNLNELGQPLGPGIESFNVIRQITLSFTQKDPDNLTSPGWQDTAVGGIYSETLTGLHKDTLNVAGTFRLHRASNVGVLNQ